MQQIQEAWGQFEGSLSNGQDLLALNLCFYMVLAGVLSLYVKLLYQWCSASPSDTESISRVFPLLSIVTTAVIAVVKSSLALSLGLVGALSIVRFRAAIKDPEELVYLFLCITVGLALGAEEPLLAIALVLVATVFIIGMHFKEGTQRRQRLLLTITGDADAYFSSGNEGVVAAVQEIAGKHSLQRFDVEGGRGQVRLVLGESRPERTAEIITQLHERLPECDVSYVNLNSTL